MYSYIALAGREKRQDPEQAKSVSRFATRQASWGPLGLVANSFAVTAASLPRTNTGVQAFYLKQILSPSPFRGQRRGPARSRWGILQPVGTRAAGFVAWWCGSKRSC